jgi:hypothetical protein
VELTKKKNKDESESKVPWTESYWEHDLTSLLEGPTYSSSLAMGIRFSSELNKYT